MRVLFFGRPQRPAPLHAMQGLRALGVRADLIRPQFYDPTAPLMRNVGAVVFDGLKRQAGIAQRRYRDAGVPTFILEMPRLRAGFDDAPTWGLYRDSLHSLPDRVGNVGRVHAPLRRGVGFEPRYVLVCGQRPDDTAHGMDEQGVSEWASRTIQATRETYGLPVVYRPHPLTMNAQPRTSHRCGADGYSHPVNETLREAMIEAAAVVVHNSTCAWDAIAAGVPVLYTATDDAISVREYAAPLGGPITPLAPDQRDRALRRAASQAWTLAQLASGEAFAVELFGEPHRTPSSLEIVPDPEYIDTTDGSRRRVRRMPRRAATASAFHTSPATLFASEEADFA